MLWTLLVPVSITAACWFYVYRNFKAGPQMPSNRMALIAIVMGTIVPVASFLVWSLFMLAWYFLSGH